MDLWGGDWSSENPVMTFWVTLSDTEMVCDTTEDAWILDENELEDEYIYFSSSELDSYLFNSYDYYDEEYQGGFWIYYELYKD